MSGISVRILGPTRVVDGGREIPLGSPAQRRVFLALLLAEGGSISLDRLIDISWSEHPPPTAVNLVHGYISGLRRALEPDRRPRDQGSILLGGSGGYRLVVDRESIDAVCFERLLEEATQRLETEPVAAVELLDQALDLWNGAALVEVADEEFARHDAARLEELRLVAIERRFQAALSSGGSAPTLADLEAFAGAHPLREQTTGLLMTALYRAGRQADALRVFGTTARALRDELGLDPSPELQALELSVLEHSPGLAAAPTMRDNLPVFASSFIGRTRELAELAQASTKARLVTLVGTGGVGKTRLALAAASARSDECPDGVWFVDLSPARDASTVAQAFAEPLGVRESKDIGLLDALAKYLRRKDLLLVVDNCEHVVDEAARAVAVLLRRCPSLRMMATSRESLRVDGEVLFAVAPLPVSERDPVADESSESSDAVRLFVERALAVRPDFRVDGESSSVLADICHRLDGLPLAIELVAPMVNVLSLGQIRSRLGNRTGTLVDANRDAPSRHASLEASMRWSYDLLTDSEQRLFEALSVFAGDFTLDAVFALIDVEEHDNETNTVFARLLDKSLVTNATPHADPPRFRLLESIREFADERLSMRGTRAAIRRRHAAVYAERAAFAAMAYRTPASAEFLEAVAQDLEEMREALRWAFGDEGDDAIGQRIVASLSWFWFVRGPLSEARDWLTAAMHIPCAESGVHLGLLAAGTFTAIPRGEFETAFEFAHQHLADAHRQADNQHAAEATEMLGYLAWIRGDYGEARRLLSDATRMSDESGSDWGAVGQLTALGRVALDMGEIDEAHRCLDTALVRARDLGEPFNIAVALEFVAQLAYAEGDTWGAATFIGEAMQLYRSIGYQEGVASALQASARVARRRGDVAVAARLYSQSLELCTQIGTIGGIPAAFEGLAWVALAASAPDAATRLLAAAGSLRSRLGAALPASVAADHDTLLDAGRSALGSSFDDVWSAAAAMPLDAMIAEATDLASGVTHA